MGARERSLESLVTAMDYSYFKGRRVLVTGITGFKGSWLCCILQNLGAEVSGFGLVPHTDPSLYELLQLSECSNTTIADIRDGEAVKEAFDRFEPEVVLHLAAQPIVRDGYKQPVYTYETNVMGTVNVCECVRTSGSVVSFLNVTTDKVYLNREDESVAYREEDPLDGYDPYSNSKSCSELVTHSYDKSFLREAGVAVSTARAGNVIGGGDFSNDRIICDCVRSVISGRTIVVRNPDSTRPYQHVLEPLFAYLVIAQEQAKDASLAGCYNVGPDECDCVDTGSLVKLFCSKWGEGARWRVESDGGPHEASFLKLDSGKLKNAFGWVPRWHIEDAVEKTVEWTKAWQAGDDLRGVVDRQIDDYMKGM
ncbi:CDP-glucose 4,6-dehydratase [Eggerthella timonensis]|uniref:CDP-glucose 4,6-dehydratase n=1 Tax=Eggerthella timonensis TaxID=1871008 RepID=UPI001C60F397|nr:CDP-glucose 4,6-dehydratase [Eggerthella timonensis]